MLGAPTPPVLKKEGFQDNTLQRMLQARHKEARSNSEAACAEYTESLPVHLCVTMSSLGRWGGPGRSLNSWETQANQLLILGQE